MTATRERTLTCRGYTSMHDGREPRRYWHPATTRTAGRHAVLCRGCATVLESMGADWRLDRRSDPQRPDRGLLARFLRRPAPRLGHPDFAGPGGLTSGDEGARTKAPPETGAGRPGRALMGRSLSLPPL